MKGNTWAERSIKKAKSEVAIDIEISIQSKLQYLSHQNQIYIMVLNSLALSTIVPVVSFKHVLTYRKFPK